MVAPHIDSFVSKQYAWLLTKLLFQPLVFNHTTNLSFNEKHVAAEYLGRLDPSFLYGRFIYFSLLKICPILPLQDNVTVKIQINSRVTTYGP